MAVSAEGSLSAVYGHHISSAQVSDSVAPGSAVNTRKVNTAGAGAGTGSLPGVPCCFENGSEYRPVQGTRPQCASVSCLLDTGQSTAFFYVV